MELGACGKISHDSQVIIELTLCKDLRIDTWSEPFKFDSKMISLMRGLPSLGIY